MNAGRVRRAVFTVLCDSISSPTENPQAWGSSQILFSVPVFGHIKTIASKYLPVLHNLPTDLI